VVDRASGIVLAALTAGVVLAAVTVDGVVVPEASLKQTESNGMPAFRISRSVFS
jgi:hypothetical protein